MEKEISSLKPIGIIKNEANSKDQRCKELEQQVKRRKTS